MLPARDGGADATDDATDRIITPQFSSNFNNVHMVIVGLLKTSALGTGTLNLDFDVLEVYNGIDPGTNGEARTAWFSLLNQGILKTGSAASDSHKITGQTPAYPRTYVAYSGEAATFDATLVVSRTPPREARLENIVRPQCGEARRQLALRQGRPLHRRR